MTRFRMDNTEGYAQEQLDELNRRFEAAVAELGTEERERAQAGDKLDHVAERVLTEFDAASWSRRTTRVSRAGRGGFAPSGVAKGRANGGGCDARSHPFPFSKHTVRSPSNCMA